MKLTVTKRDGSHENFSPEKIARVVKAAGLSETKTHKLINDLNEWVKGLDKPEITSLQVRDKVLDELKNLDEYAANMFSWYQKTKGGK